jgi:AAA domain
MTAETYQPFTEVPIEDDPPEAHPGKGKGHTNGHAAEAATIAPYPFWRLADMRALKVPRFIVDKIIPDGSRTLIIAPSGHYKTMTAVDLVMSIAYRTDFHGLAVERMPIIYVANEDAYGVARQRILGWLDYYEERDERIVVIPGDVLLNDPDTPAKLFATGEAAFPAERFGVVLDTWDKSIGGDPDKTSEVVPAVMRTEELTKAGRCAFVLTLAHTPWSNSERSKGSVTFWASQEARIKVERNEVTGAGTLDVLHIKNGQPGLHLEFDYELHEFGPELERATTLIPRRRMEASERREGTAAESRARKLGPNEKVLLDALAAAIADGPDPTPLSLEVPASTPGATIERWQTYAFRYLPQSEAKRKAEAFNRASTRLVADRMVRHVGGFAWLP